MSAREFNKIFFNNPKLLEYASGVFKSKATVRVYRYFCDEVVAMARTCAEDLEMPKASVYASFNFLRDAGVVEPVASRRREGKGGPKETVWRLKL